MKVIFSIILLLNFLISKSQLNVVKFNCADSIRYVTNQGVLGNCTFYFQGKNHNIFYVENFDPQDLYDVLYKNDRRKLSRIKLLTPQYTAHVHDFIFATEEGDKIKFYYIVKDAIEERRLMYHD